MAEMAEYPIEKKEQGLWGKIRKKLIFKKDATDGLGAEQERLVDKYVGRGIKATPKEERERDIKILLPKASEREIE